MYGPGIMLHIEAEAEWLVCEDVVHSRDCRLCTDLPVPGSRGKADARLRSISARLAPAFLRVVGGYSALSRRHGAFTLNVPHEFYEDELVDFFPFRASGVSNEGPHLARRLLHFEKSKCRRPRASVGVLVTRLQGRWSAFKPFSSAIPAGPLRTKPEATRRACCGCWFRPLWAA